MGKKHKTVQEIAKDFWHTNNIALYLKNEDAEKYNSEPVYWCAVCKSLKIQRCDSPLDRELECFCADCGAVEMRKGTIEEWIEVTSNNTVKY